MSKDLPINEHYISRNLYTFEELKDFTNNFTDRNIINLTKFVEVKTNKKYVIVERQTEIFFYCGNFTKKK